MANQSIYSAFERMWEHTSVADSEIRSLISELTERFNALANSDDTTLDTLKEIVDYIKSNKTLIESVTTTKVNVDDIINDLITNEPKKPLSAAQGKALKDLIDALQTAINNITIPVTSVNNKTGAVNLTASDVGALPSTTTIPTKISELTNDSEFATEQYVDEEIEDHDTSPLAHANKMNSQNPVGEGSFSMNRDPDTTIGINSFAEGMMTEASGDYSHAEGNNTTAEGKSSHAEGNSTEALGDYSHTEGRDTVAHGAYSHVEGYRNSAYEDYVHVQGKFSKSASDAAHIVGNGSEEQSSNAHTLDWEGNAWFAGDVYVGSDSGTNRDEGSKKLATEEYVDNANKVYFLDYGTSTWDDYLAIANHFTDGVILCRYWHNSTKPSYLTGCSFNYGVPVIRFTGIQFDNIIEVSLSNSGGWSSNIYSIEDHIAEADKVFIAEYGVTTASEIQSAIGEGKAVFCKYTTEDTTTPYLLAPLTETTSVSDTFSTIDNRGRQWIFALVKTNGNWTMQKDQVVRESGGDMTGTLTLASDPTEALHAATKQYVDANANKVFIAEYDVTTEAELQEAYNSGCAVYCDYTTEYGETVRLPLISDNFLSMGLFVFSGVYNGYSIVITLYRNDSWDMGDCYWGNTSCHYPVMNAQKVLSDRLVAQNNTDYTTKQVRNIILVADGEEIPAGANGDICLVYAL